MTDLALTVLGSGPSWPNPGGACAGYLVSADGAHVLLDCGHGVAGRLLETVRLGDLSAIVISHMHPDHMLDLVPLRQGMRYGPLAPDRPPPLLVPPGGAERLAKLAQALGSGDDFFAGTFDLREYDPQATIRLGPFAFSFRLVRHSLPNYAMRIERGGILVYSGDAAPSEELVEQARGADALLCEATLGRAEEDPGHERSHMTPGEAGVVASRAGVRRLMLTHHPINAADPDRPVREARAHFPGWVERARDGARYSISGG